MTARSALGVDVGSSFQETASYPEMVVVPSGSFLMSTGEDEPGGSQSARRLVSFPHKMAIGKFPVTFTQWEPFFRSGGAGEYEPFDSGWGQESRPVIDVSWHQAQSYVAWLNANLDIAPDHPFRYRLPTEAEWEYACRAGTTGPFSTRNGRINPKLANYWTLGHEPLLSRLFPRLFPALQAPQKTSPVGSYPPNPWGLYDMHGNVWEWCEDFSDAPSTDHSGATAWALANPNRVTRGGCWYALDYGCTSSSRADFPPATNSYLIGFRVAMTLPS